MTVDVSLSRYLYIVWSISYLVNDILFEADEVVGRNLFKSFLFAMMTNALEKVTHNWLIFCH